MCLLWLFKAAEAVLVELLVTGSVISNISDFKNNAGINSVIVARSGWSKQGGYEIY